MRSAPRQPRDSRRLVALCPDQQSERLIQQSLSPASAVAFVRDWNAFAGEVSGADCAIAVVSWVDSAAIKELRAVKARYPRVPLVLITHGDAANVRLLRDVEIDELLWINEVRVRLGAIVEQVCGAAFLSMVADAVEQQWHLEPSVRAFIAAACRSHGDVPSEGELTRRLGVSRTSLWRARTEAVPDGPTMNEFLDWVLLLNAMTRRGTAKSWAAVARELGVHDHTLANVAERLTGRQLSDLWAKQAAVESLFENSVLKRLGTQLPRNK